MRNKHKTIQKAKSTGLLKSGAVVMLLSLIILALYFIVKFPKDDTEYQGAKNVASQPGAMSKSERPAWEKYTNNEYGIVFEIPKLLLEKEAKNDNYLFFIRFEENKFSREKGVALGISETNIKEEITKVKKDLEEQDGELVKENEINLGEVTGVRLDFKPKETESGEERSIVFFERFGKIYSISTVPGQIDRVVESIKFF
ncbi:MAG: hypothetical protein UT08_C0005G0034 [Candidatus Woesebacteria bacterium GW2011_GWB1_38_8]|uniref:Uncharacterized protein n=1 Tax=Candidatus Woesebacteria bacterium GW2011_GWB1_38_8 TaxID=1618570 RepID=A0A0G0L0Y7_9BACT|nr:MAG: hypothetical protein UT08_C0005G0034 [Candidatus Woesebacteria bacterium GW2011_GWB1_38_8]